VVVLMLPAAELTVSFSTLARPPSDPNPECE
jgi:hypothetical protein